MLLSQNAKLGSTSSKNCAGKATSHTLSDQKSNLSDHKGHNPIPGVQTQLRKLMLRSALAAAVLVKKLKKKKKKKKKKLVKVVRLGLLVVGTISNLFHVV